MTWKLNIEEEPCTEGATRCKDGNLEECIDGTWQIIEEDSSQCKGIPEEYLIAAAAVAVVILLSMR